MAWKKWCTRVLVIMTVCLPMPSSSEELTIQPEKIINGSSSSTEELTFAPEDIIDGEYVDIKTIEFPFFISSDPPGDLCGGSLIADDLVLTAAHCCLNSYNYNTSYAQYLFKKGVLVTVAPVFKDGSHVKAEIGEVFVHPKYGDATFNDMDFCILILKAPVQNAVTICLAPEKARKPAPGEILTAIGFGDTEIGSYSPPPVLKKGSLVVVPCTELLVEGITLNDITENMFCAKKAPSAIANQALPGADCFGDSGGPVFDKYGIQYGVVDWGPSDCTLGSIYAFVPSAQPWIKQVSKYSNSKIDKKDCWKPPNTGSKKGKKSGRRLDTQPRIERAKGGRHKEAVTQVEINPNGQIFSTNRGVYNNRLAGRKV